MFPDYYVAETQQQFASFFSNLTITKANNPKPTYQVNVITEQGVSALEYVPVPQ